MFAHSVFRVPKPPVARNPNAYLGPLAYKAAINSKVVNTKYAVPNALAKRADVLEMNPKVRNRVNFTNVEEVRPASVSSTTRSSDVASTTRIS